MTLDRIQQVTEKLSTAFVMVMGIAFLAVLVWAAKLDHDTKVLQIVSGVCSHA